MSELPQGWAFASLNELQAQGGIFADGDWIESKDQDPNGRNRLLQLADIGDGRFIDKSSRYVNDETFDRLNCTALEEGDILLARMPDPLGRACLMPRLPQRCLTVVDVAVFRSGSRDISHRWLMHTLNASPIREEISRNASGTTRKRIARGKLAELKVPVPPAAEQKRIAQKLDALLAQVDTLKARIDAIPALLKRFRQCVLQAASTGDLTASWATKEGASKWINLRFRELLRDFRGGASIRPSGETQGTPVLRSSAVRPMLVNFEDVSHFDKSMTLNPNDYAMEGDLIFTRLSGSAEFVGVCGRVKATPRVPTQFPDRLFCARLINSRYAPYLEIFFSSQNYISYIGRNLKSSAGHQRITTETVKNAEIRLPSLEEQTEIVRRVEQLFAYADQLEAKVVAAQQRIDALTKSLLAKAFRGELVPQDPSDEPASVLLDRIRAQRAAASKPKRGRKAATS
ncbi:restriction endonuclease subunit S [Xanthomonas oryzae]|uniref:restriction endonuclease subunit S n=1 Tax=Xanthomonas oryzae TaxID=347 RepID=UPI003D16B7F5